MKAKKIISIAIAIMMIVALAVPAFADAQYAVNLGVDSKIKTGTDFTVTIKVTTPELSNGVGFILTYDHTKMTYKSYACSVANCNVNVIEDGKLELVSSMDAKQYNDETWMTITFTAGNDEATNVEFTTLYSDDVTFMNADADVVEANDISFGTATTDIVVPHTAPVINGLAIAGDGQVGNALTASYESVTDNWGLTATVAYTWTVGGAAATGTVSADGTQYTPVAADIGKTVTVSAVATVSDDSFEQGDTTTTSAAATATKDIVANATATASVANAEFDKDVMAVGVPVTVGYDFTASVNEGDDASTFAWYRDNDPIQGATESTYTPTMDDFGKTLKVVVTPQGSLDATAGTPVEVTATSAVIAGNMKPEIADLKVVKGEGADAVTTAVVGETLKAVYTYSDLDADGNDSADTDASEFVWMRDGAEIEGATEAEYTLTADDRDTNITVKVTAKSSDATPNENLGLTAETVVLGNELTSDAVAVSKNADLKPAVEITKAPKTVKIKNEAKVNYTFTDENGFGDASTAVFKQVDKNGDPVDNAITITATVKDGVASAKIEDTKLTGKYIVCEITPKNDDEPAVEGNVVKSAVIQVTSAKTGSTTGSTGPSLVSGGTSTTDPTTITDPDDPNANLPDAIKNADKGCIILVIGEKKASVFGEIKENDVAPQIVNDRTMLPCRFVAEGLGAEVDWDDSTKTVIITKGDLKIELTIGKDFAIVNGEELPLDSPAFIENDRTFTPIRFIAEALNAQVDWEEATKTVTITPKD